MINSNFSISESLQWFRKNPGFLDTGQLSNKLNNWRDFNPNQLSELVSLWHGVLPLSKLEQSGFKPEIYCEAGPNFRESGERYISQAEVALISLMIRNKFTEDDFPEKTWLNVIRSLPNRISNRLIRNVMVLISVFIERKNWPDISSVLRSEFASFLTRVAAGYEADSDKYRLYLSEEDPSRSIKAIICRLEKDPSH